MVVLLVGVPATTSLAAGERSVIPYVFEDGDKYSTTATRVNIVPWKADDYYIKLGTQTGYTRIGWGACSKGLANDAIEASSIVLTVWKNGIRLQRISGKTAKSKWRNPVIFTSAYATTADCGWPAANLWLSRWVHTSYPFSTLGKYTVRFIWKFSEPVTDGFVFGLPPTLNWANGTIKAASTIVHVTK
jgi:hypothetical protein